MHNLISTPWWKFRLTKQTNKQTTMKNKILALLATIGLVSSASAIEINDNLSINGFIDGSYHSVDFDGARPTPSNSDWMKSSSTSS